MSNFIKCTLCKGSIEIRHITLPLFIQEEKMNGKHIHICKRCFNKRYKTIKKELKKIEFEILDEVTKNG